MNTIVVMDTDLENVMIVPSYVVRVTDESNVAVMVDGVQHGVGGCEVYMSDDDRVVVPFVNAVIFSGILLETSAQPVNLTQRQNAALLQLQKKMTDEVEPKTEETENENK